MNVGLGMLEVGLFGFWNIQGGGGGGSGGGGSGLYKVYGALRHISLLLVNAYYFGTH